MRQFALLAVSLTAQVAVAAQSAVPRPCAVVHAPSGIGMQRWLRCGERRGPLVHTRSVLPTAGP